MNLRTAKNADLLQVVIYVSLTLMLYFMNLEWYFVALSACLDLTLIVQVWKERKLN